jgi:hypothetical protein
MKELVPYVTLRATASEEVIELSEEQQEAQREGYRNANQQARRDLGNVYELIELGGAAGTRKGGMSFRQFRSVQI